MRGKRANVDLSNSLRHPQPDSESWFSSRVGVPGIDRGRASACCPQSFSGTVGPTCRVPVPVQRRLEVVGDEATVTVAQKRQMRRRVKELFRKIIRCRASCWLSIGRRRGQELGQRFQVRFGPDPTRVEKKS